MVDYDPFGQEVIHGDPHPILRALRDESPHHYLERWDAWALSRFEDVWTACTNTECFSSAEGTTSSHLLTKVQEVPVKMASEQNLGAVRLSEEA